VQKVELSEQEKALFSSISPAVEQQADKLLGYPYADEAEVVPEVKQFGGENDKKEDPTSSNKIEMAFLPQSQQEQLEGSPSLDPANYEYKCRFCAKSF